MKEIKLRSFHAWYAIDRLFFDINKPGDVYNKQQLNEYHTMKTALIMDINSKNNNKLNRNVTAAKINSVFEESTNIAAFSIQYGINLLESKYKKSKGKECKNRKMHQLSPRVKQLLTNTGFSDDMMDDFRVPRTSPKKGMDTFEMGETMEKEYLRECMDHIFRTTHSEFYYNTNGKEIEFNKSYYLLRDKLINMFIQTKHK